MEQIIEQCLYSIRVVADDCESECEPDRARLLRTCARLLEDEILRYESAIHINAGLRGPVWSIAMDQASEDGDRTVKGVYDPKTCEYHIQGEEGMDWKKWSEAWPDWQDAGMRVEIDRGDGTTVTGKLYVDDFFPDGEGDEVPVFAVIDDAGTKHSFADNKRWRFLMTPNAEVTGA